MTKLIVSVGVIALAILTIIRFAPPLSVSSVNTQKTDLFSVSGEGKVTVIPDTAIINLGIIESRPDVRSAQTTVNQVMDKITSDLKSLGIESKDIKTQNYSIYPQYDYKNGTGRIISYNVSSNLSVTVRQFDKINDVIDKATADGANTVGNISLVVDDAKQKQLLQQARSQAVAEAKNKAAGLAGAAGITLGRIVNIQESSGDMPRPIMMMNKAIAPVGIGGGADTSISPGSTDITTSVTLYYETK